MRAALVFIILLGFAHAASAETEADRWNLADLYAAPAAWTADAEKLAAQFTEFAGCKGHLGDSVVRFRQCIELRYDMQKRYYRLAVYSGEALAADTSVAASLALDQRADLLGNKLGEADAFFDPEVLALGMEQFMELQFPPRQFLLRPWLTTTGLTMIDALPGHGKTWLPGHGKTWLALSIAYSVAAGQTLCGFEVDDVDAAYADLVEQGATSVAAPQDRPAWGARAANLADPAGVT